MTLVVLKDAGELSGTGHCDVITEAFNLPVCIHGNTRVLGELTEVRFPEVKAMFMVEEYMLLLTDVNYILEVLKLDESLDTIKMKEHSHKVKRD